MKNTWYLTFAALGLVALAMLGFYEGTTPTQATVYGNYTAQDNGDSCLDPKETLELVVKDGTRELFWDFEEKHSKNIRSVIAALNGVPEDQLLEFDRMQIYDYPDQNGVDVVHIYLFNKGCLIVDFEDNMDGITFILSMTPDLPLSREAPITGKDGFIPEALKG